MHCPKVDIDEDLARKAFALLFKKFNACQKDMHKLLPAHMLSYVAICRRNNAIYAISEVIANDVLCNDIDPWSFHAWELHTADNFPVYMDSRTSTLADVLEKLLVVSNEMMQDIYIHDDLFIKKNTSLEQLLVEIDLSEHML